MLTFNVSRSGATARSVSRGGSTSGAAAASRPASLKWTRVPDYWGFDEKFPHNRLPYVDEINALFMSDPAARMAALRSGKVDVLGTVGDSQVRSIDQIKSLQQTNPEINTWTYKFRSEHAFAPNNINPK